MVKLHLPLQVESIALLLVLSLPHVLYFLTWTQASSFIQLSKRIKYKSAVELFYQMAVALKVVQYVGLGLWGASVSLSLEFSPLRVFLFAVLFGAGQILNYYVYKTLGKAGVYYGVRLGQKIAWYSGFPFSVVPHPQYVGCILSIWGLTSLFFNQANIDVGLLTVAVIWSAFYVVTGLIEEHM